MNKFSAWLRTSLLRLRALFNNRKLDEEFDQEIRSHLALLEQENIRRGMSPEEAHYAALRSFGGVTQVKESNRQQRAFRQVEVLLQDLRYALRMMRKNPGFMAVAVLTLALGIGANTAIFSVVEGVVLAPLPYSDPERLVFVFENNLKLKHIIFTSYPDFLDWQRNARSFQQMAAFDFTSVDLTSPGTAEHLDSKEISAGFFSTLGVKLTLGHEFSPDENKPGGSPLAVISDHLWRDRFGASPEALGKSVTLNGIGYTVVGVLPPGFYFWTPADVYVPLGQGDPVLNDRITHKFTCIARLKTGVNLGQAQAEMTTIQQNITQLYPDLDRGLGADVLPLKQMIVGDARGTLFLLLGAVGIVLLIACANVANLLLARSAARRHEFAIRSALGASRRRIARQLMTESVLLSLVGGGLGLALAKWGLKAVLAAVPGGMPRSENVGLNIYVLVFAFGISTAVGILFGLAPALKSSRVDVQDSLKQGNRVSSGGHRRTRGGLVIVQMALTLVLLAGAGLLFQTIRHLWEVNPGFSVQHVITFKVGLSASANHTPSTMRAAYQQLLDRIRQVPGVEAADLTTLVPLSNADNALPFWVGSPPASIAEAPRTTIYSTGPDYLKTMGIPLLRGRFFTADDTIRSNPVVVIDDVLARTYFPGRDPLGQTVTFIHVGPYRVVGVVGHVRHYDLGDSRTYAPNQAYSAFYQISDQWLPVMHESTTVVLRTPLDMAAILPTIKAAVYGTGSDQPVYDMHTMRETISESMSSQRFPMILLGTFAGLALLLAFVGIYGVISYLTTERVHEIGIRMALGAEKWDVLRMILGQGLRLALPGIAIGTGAALILGQLLSSFSHLLYGVRPRDPLTLIGVSLILLSAALLACYIPARRAAGVDPMVALHHE
ncbi:MAG TPA: ABC transporter permease [Candidatus Angelobacter sp.]|nr:ABC transporter permease [Candidatus Angelobacter sp.]